MRGRVARRGKTWYYQVDLPNYPDGRRRQKLKGGFRTRKDAESALANLLVDVEKGLPGVTSKQRVTDFLTDWHASVAPSQHPNTAGLNERAIRNWIVPRIGGMRVADITPATLQGLYNALSAEANLGERSIRLAHTIMNQALGQALEWGVIGRNPAAAKLTIPKKKGKRVMTAWSVDETRRFLAATHDTPEGPMWALFLSTGLRRGEVLGLHWSHVDLEHRELRVAGTWVAMPTGRGGESAAKTKGSERSVFLMDMALDALSRQLVRQTREAYKGGDAWQNTGFVFTDALGAPLEPRRIGVLFHRAAEAAGVPSIRPHDMRHTFASVALETGVPAKLVQEILGHAKITTTLDTYTHSNAQLHESAMRTIGAALGVTRETPVLSAPGNTAVQATP